MMILLGAIVVYLAGMAMGVIATLMAQAYQETRTQTRVDRLRQLQERHRA